MSDLNRVLGGGGGASLAPEKPKPKRAARITRDQLVADFLRAVLGPEPMTVGVLEQRAKSAGLLPASGSISQDRTFRRVRELLHVECFQASRRWLWKLPSSDVAATSDGTKDGTNRKPAPPESPAAPIPDPRPMADDLNAGKKPSGAAKDSRLAVATDFVCSVLFAGGGSAPALEIEKRARAAGLLEQGALIGQSRMFRQIKKSLSVEVHRRGFGKGSTWIWQIPGTVVRVGELEPEPIDAAPIEADRVINEPPIAAATMSPAAQIDGVASEEAAVINGEPPIAAATIEAVANRQSEEKAAINDAPPISPPAAPRSSEPRPSHRERCADNQEARAAATVQQWQEGFRSLDPGRPPPLVPYHAWTEFIRASAQFLNSPLALRAVRLGWDALSLFGFPPHGGLTARSELGPLWIGRVLEIDSGGAVVEYAGAKRAYTKRPPGSRIRVPWDIERRRPVSPAGEQSQQRHWVRA